MLHEHEMDAMRICGYLADSYNSRAKSKDFARWNENNPDAARALDWAAQEYAKWLTP